MTTQKLDDAGYSKRPLCPFCNAQWTDGMIELEDQAAGCPTCGHGGGGTIKIECYACDRLIYQKDHY